MDAGELPFVSVVVPVYNDPDGIEVTLETAVEQSYPDDRYEVVAVDNGSDDETRDVIRRFRRRFERVKMASETDVRGPGAARNEGIEQSDGSILAFIDADMTAEDDWLRKGVRRFVRDDVDCLGCDIEVKPATDRPRIWEAYEQIRGLPVEGMIERIGFIPTGSLFVRRSVFEDVGKFDSRLTSGEDVEFGIRLRDAGYELHYEPDVTMYHPTRDSFRALLEKHVKIGNGQYLLSLYHPEHFGTPALRMLHPKTYLPPLPFQVAWYCEQWDEYSARQKAVFWLLECLVTTSQNVGLVKGWATRNVGRLFSRAGGASGHGN